VNDSAQEPQIVDAKSCLYDRVISAEGAIRNGGIRRVASARKNPIHDNGKNRTLMSFMESESAPAACMNADTERRSVIKLARALGELIDFPPDANARSVTLRRIGPRKIPAVAMYWL